MPRRMKRPCKTLGCPGDAPGGGYCEACRKRRGEAAPALADYERERGSSSARGYNRRWRALRLLVLRESPACVECGEPATDVDHIVPKRDGGTDERENLQALCHSCHSRKTLAEGGGSAVDLAFEW